MGKKDALEAFEVSATRRVSPALRGAEPAQMAVTDAGLSQVSCELVLREAFLARDWRGPDVEDELDARVFERADEGGDGSALIADGADGPWPHWKLRPITKMDGCQ